MAEIQWNSGATSFMDPEVSSSEKWAIYATQPHLHKLIGNLETGFYSIIAFSALANYIHHKHNLTEAKLQRVHMVALSSHLATLKPYQRASMVKMIHGWIPTYGILYRQGREPSPLYPRCTSTVETWKHVFSCPNFQATENRREALLNFLSSLAKLGTPLYILSTFKYKLSNVFAIPFQLTCSVTSLLPITTKKRLIEAIWHQDFIGWDNFICGYTSSLWDDLVQVAQRDDPLLVSHNQWAVKLVEATFQCSHSIWQARNNILHGTSRLEAKQLLRQRVLDQFRRIYKHPPYLHSHFQKISRIPLAQRLTRSTTNLQHWLSSLKHQPHVSSLLKQQSPYTQLSLKQAYRRSKVSLLDACKFPP